MTAELLATAAEMWPGAEVVPADLLADGRPVRARYAVLGGEAPTVLVPVDPPAAAGATLRRRSSATGWGTFAARSIASMAVRRAPQLLRRQVEVRGGGPGLAEHLGDLLGEEVCFSISIGTARVNRKPVLQVFDRHGACRAFGKVGWSSHTCTDVISEGRALVTVGARHLERVVPPALLARSTWEGRPVILTEPLSAGRRLAGRGRHRPWEPPWAAMAELAASFAEESRSLAGSAWWARQWRLLGSLHEPVIRGRLGRAMEAIARLAEDRPLEWGAWHGDWTPWNMARGGALTLLWDWERFETGVPAGLDAIHYVLNVVTGGTALTPDGVQHAIGLALDHPRWPVEEGPLAARLYLVAILIRYLRLSDGPGGEHISQRATQMLVALERMCAD